MASQHSCPSSEESVVEGRDCRYVRNPIDHIDRHLFKPLRSEVDLRTITLIDTLSQLSTAWAHTADI
jgi:hypothetical protein